MDLLHVPPLDPRGVLIEEGDLAAYAGGSGRMILARVKRIERPGLPEWWVNVRFEGGYCTTPERLVIVEKAAS